MNRQERRSADRTDQQIIFNRLRDMQRDGHEKLVGLGRQQLKAVADWLLENYPIEDLERKVFGNDL